MLPGGITPELHILGTMSVRVGPERELSAVLAQPKRFALLAYMAAATPRGYHRRDTLLALFWPDADQEHARSSLRKAVHFLRQQLDPVAVAVEGVQPQVAGEGLPLPVVDLEAEGRQPSARLLQGGDGVQQQRRVRVQEFLRHYQTERQLTVVLTSHYMKDIAALCRRVIIITQGRIMYDGSLSGIIEGPTQIQSSLAGMTYVSVSAVLYLALVATIIGFVEAPQLGLDLPLDVRGTAFQQRVWQALREIHSPHVQQVSERLERSRELHSWKEGTAFQVSASGGLRRGADAALPIKATAATFAGDGKLLYFLRDERMGGLFEQDLQSGEERRLLHRQNLLLDDLRAHPDGRLLCAQLSSSGTSNIVLMDREGDHLRELTAGDTIDSAPCWVADAPGTVLFQSRGVARSAEGFPLAHGPATIQLLDLADGALTPVLDSEHWDHLQPRVAADGSLLFIRRPYQRPRYGAADLLVDALLFPFRFLRALFHYFNFFSLMYARKPLTSASGPRVEADLKEIELQGRRIDAEAALRTGTAVNGVRSLVPASWELVRRSRQGAEQVLARHVAAFDIGPDGQLLYSNGNGVFVLGADGESQVLLRDNLVVDVVAG